MPTIRGVIRSLSATREDMLTVINREWTPILRQVVRQLNGRFGTVRTVTSDYTCATDDQVILADSPAGLTVTLPAADSSNMRISVKSLDGTSVVNVAPAAGDTLEGMAMAYSLAGTNDAIDVVSDGDAAWHIVAEVV